MSFFRSYWTWTDDYPGLRATALAWGQRNSSRIPGFSGIWFGTDLDEPDFHFVSIETNDRSAFAPQPAPAIDEFTELLRTVQSGSGFRFADTEDVSYFEADGVVDNDGKGHADAWILTDHAEEVTERVQAWQKRHLAETPGFERAWFVRGISDPRLHSISMQFSSIEAVLDVGWPAFDQLSAEIRPLLLADPDRRRGGGDEVTE